MKLQVAMQLADGSVIIDGTKTKVKLPKGCVGLLFVFKSKTAGENYFQKEIDFIEIDTKEPI